MAAAAAAYVSFVPPLLGRIDSELKEIRVCTNRTCRRQGSIQTLHTLSGLAQPEVAVSSCGCLGRCGAGPNIVALPDGVVIGHCGTAARACQVMVELSGGRTDSVVDANKSLEALALRKRAESEIEKRNLSEAEILLSQAIDLKPFGGIHLIYKVRSLARLAMGNYSGALEDVREALKLASNYTEAYICQGDIFLAMDQYDAAEKSYATCLEIDPSIRRSKSFKSRIVKLQEKLTAANIPQSLHYTECAYSNNDQCCQNKFHVSRLIDSCYHNGLMFQLPAPPPLSLFMPFIMMVLKSNWWSP